MKRLEALGLRAAQLRLVGGGSRNRVWRRIVADAFQLPLRLPAEAEAAALGGALQVHRGGAVGTGVRLGGWGACWGAGLRVRFG
jgi:sugar (pentulose or hexulose) kinase